MLNQITDYLIPIATFFLSLFAFLFTLLEFLKKRPNIKLRFVHTEELVEIIPIRKDKTDPDQLWHYKYRLFPTVVITNKSSSPITILDIVINDEVSFNRYRDLHGPNYQTPVPIEENPQLNKRFGLNTRFETAGMKIEGKILDKVFTIPPHTSAFGTLFFAYNESLMGTNKITVQTDVKNFNFKLAILKSYSKD